MSASPAGVRGGQRGRHVAVVGAGAAGLTAAIRAAEAGAQVTLLNAHPKTGLKILMSGGTRCNVTHHEVDARDFNGGSRNVIARVLREFPARAAHDWMESLGVRLKLEPSGKYFPQTDDAETVLEALLHRSRACGVELLTGARVVRLERSGEGFRLGVQHVTNAATFGAEVKGQGAMEWPLPSANPDVWREADAVVMATGGVSFPRTGSDGTGYALLQSLGHSIVPPVPALTPLTARDPWCVRLQGLTLPVVLRLGPGKRATFVGGSMMFAHFGYTGPAALDLSRHWLRAAESERRVEVTFLPDSSDTLEKGRWRGEMTRPRRTVRSHFAGLIPQRLTEEACRDAGVDPAEGLGQVERAARERLLALLTARVLPVEGTLGFEKAEVTAGGIPLDEVEPRSLESRKVPGLFLCGELLDVEGRLGGFNFQWAWSSGTVVGRAAGGRLGQGPSRLPVS